MTMPSIKHIQVSDLEAQPKRGRCLLFGGAFDPIHNAHLEVARFLSQKFPDDSILLMPSRPGKVQSGTLEHSAIELKEQMATPKHRIAMIERGLLSLNLNSYENISISTLEVDENKNHPSRTFETVEQLSPYFQSISVIVGSDQWKSIEKWFQAEKLVREVQFIVFQRAGSTLHTPELSPLNFEVFEAVNKDCSSSKIRRFFKENTVTLDDFRGPIKHLEDCLPLEIAEYCIQWQIYKDR